MFRLFVVSLLLSFAVPGLAQTTEPGPIIEKSSVPFEGTNIAGEPGASVPAESAEPTPTTQAAANVAPPEAVPLQPDSAVPSGSTCIDPQKDVCLATLSWGPAVGVALFTLNKNGTEPFNFGGAGGQIAIDAWRANDGHFRLHFSLGALIGGGTVNPGGKAGVAQLVIPLSLGFGGFDHIPLISFGPSLFVPLHAGLPVQFGVTATGAALTWIQTFG